VGPNSDMSETWWGQRWNRVLESFGWGNRPARGRSDARAGHVLGWRTAPGLVTAHVQGSQRIPYKVTIKIKTLSGGEWDRVITALAGRAILVARLLAGEMPQDIEEVFAEAKLSLFPAASRDIETTCSCPDRANPCKHIAAVYYVLGRRFDADPFLLFQLRGKEREELLQDLQGRRAGGLPEDRPDGAAGGFVCDALTADPELFWSTGPLLSRLELHFAPPGTAAALLKRLGPLPWWWNRVEPQEWLAECYQTVTERALADLDKL